MKSSQAVVGSRGLDEEWGRGGELNPDGPGQMPVSQN